MQTIKIEDKDIQTIRRIHPRLIFVIGSLCSGKKFHIQKLINEMKLGYINLPALFKKHVESDDNLKALFNHFQEQNQPIPSVWKCKVLLEEINQINKPIIIIEGFPKTLNDALYFEQNIIPITCIINFLAKPETSLKLKKEFPKVEGKEFNEEQFLAKHSARQETLKDLLSFYKQVGVLRDINADKTPRDITVQFKQSIYPTVYSIIGKRYSGKTELSQILYQREGIHLIDFTQFKYSPKNKKHFKDDAFLVNGLINMLRTLDTQRVLIENFPENKEQYSFFVNNCKQFENIYYLNADNSTCFERRNALSITDPNYIDCCELNQLLFEFEQQSEFIKFLKKQTIRNRPKYENGFFAEEKPEEPPKPKPKPAEGEEPPKVKKEEPIDLTNKRLILMEIDVNNHKKLTIEKFINQIQPFIMMVNSKPDLLENKTSLVQKLGNDYEFEVIDLPKILPNHIKRYFTSEMIAQMVPEGQELSMCFSLDLMIKIVRPIIFKESCSRYILENFPVDIAQFEGFEKNLCYINKMIYISSDAVLEDVKDIELHFKNTSNLFIMPAGEVTDYQVKEMLNLTKDINIVYGMPLSGKTSFAKHLEKKHNYTLLDFQNLVKMVKVKKSKADPENADADPESVEITFDDLIDGLKDYLEKETKNKRILIDNFFIPGGAEPFIVDNVDKAKTVIQTIGNFRNLYQMTIDEKIALDRYKAKEGIAEEMNEEQQQAYQDSLKAPTELLELIKSLSGNVIEINNSETLDKTKKDFDFANTKNFIIIKHKYDINIERCLEMFAAQNKVLYINVPKLIYSHFEKNDEISKKLEDSYGRRTLMSEIREEEDKDGFIYYKYNPINFEPSLVNEIILSCVNEKYKEIECSGNFIILTGYLNSDLLEESETPFNLPLLELKNLFELGEFTAYIQITKEEIQENETEEPVQLIIEKPKKIVKVDELDVDGNPEAENQPQEEQPPEEEENPDGVKKFNPEGLFWTYYDGKPRNYVQVLKRWKPFPVKQVASSAENLESDLKGTLKEHLEQYMNRKTTNYKGTIDVIKV